MNRFVVDASVATKWFLPEEHAVAAQRLLTGSVELVAPDLLLAEVGNVVWQRLQRRELSRDEGSRILADLRRAPLNFFGPAPYLAAAWDFAAQYSVSFYDALYCALAVRLAAPLVTADRQLQRLLAKTEIAPLCVWVTDVP